MIVFHHNIREQLLKQLSLRRMSQSLLLTGPQGVGKQTLARWYAQALICESRSSMRPCSTCAACRAAALGAHPDITVASDEEHQTMSIERWRLMQERLTRTPLRSSSSVLIVPNCERLSVAAQHACLKTLEEPRTASVLILTAASTNNILPTMLSRLTHVSLKPVPGKDLHKALKEADPGLPPSTVEAWSAAARGIPGKILQNDALRADAKEHFDNVQAMGALKGVPFWKVGNVVREIMDSDNPRELYIDTLSSVVRQTAKEEASVRTLQLQRALARAFTQPVNKDLALDAFCFILARSALQPHNEHIKYL